MDDPRGEVVRTGHPITMLVACTVCGVLLWDIDAHYGYAHPDFRPEGSDHE